MAERGQDVRGLLNRLGLAPEGGPPLTANKLPPAARDAQDNSLAAFFDSVRRAPPPQTTTINIPATVERDQPMSGKGRGEIPPTKDATVRLDAAPTPQQWGGPVPPTEWLPSAATGRVTLPERAAGETPLAEVFKRLREAGGGA